MIGSLQTGNTVYLSLYHILLMKIILVTVTCICSGLHKLSSRSSKRLNSQGSFASQGCMTLMFDPLTNKTSIIKKNPHRYQKARIVCMQTDSLVGTLYLCRFVGLLNMQEYTLYGPRRNMHEWGGRTVDQNMRVLCDLNDIPTLSSKMYDFCLVLFCCIQTSCRLMFVCRVASYNTQEHY